MKYLAQHIIILLAALAAVMLGGCVNDYDTCDEPRLQDEMQLRFTLKLDVLDDLFSRADGIWNPEDPVVPGSSFDNTIILKTTKNPGYKWLHVMLINNSTDEIAHIDLMNLPLNHWEKDFIKSTLNSTSRNETGQQENTD